ncbi:MAG: hypothetical protein E7515_03945 [Ruminococcaceae bacterium]|nr:hypothetical protein [Oscillospiraceae bacterium]
MAKQKKKDKKKKPQLSKKDKKLFRLVGAISCIVSSFLAIINIELFIPYLAKITAEKGSVYSVINFSFPALLMGLAPLAISLIILINYDNSTYLGIPFKEYYSGKSEKANKQIKTTFCVALCFVILWGSMIPIMIKSYDNADLKQITRHYITKQDEVIFEFNDVKSIDVGINRIFSGKNATKVYTVYMELEDNNGNSFNMNAEDFTDNIVGFEKFLNQFDRSIVTVNKKYSEHLTYPFDAESGKAFHRIFD